MLRSMLTLTLIAGTAAGLGADEPRPHPAVLPRTTHHAPRTEGRRTPGIRIWTSGDDLMRRGERVRVFYRTERDAYVTIFRVDTDGRVKVLFPRDPDDENYGYGGATYTVSGSGQGTAFYVDDYAGVGYIFGVASTAPFNYDAIFGDGRWDLHSIGDGRIHGDPLSSLEELSGRLLPEGYGDYDTHLLPYYVEQRYNYPRFVCYDCHTYMPFTYWDPYQAWCRRFTLVVWNDPYYYYPSYWYPTRYYGGTRVVYSSPGGSRYVFKNRENAAPGIDYRDRRSTPIATAGAGGGRRVADDRGVRGTDIGGIGSVPAPRGTGRRGAGEAESPRDGRTAGGDGAVPGAVGGGADGRRRADGASDNGGNASPSPVPVDAGGRRRTDAQPGIEIVPRPDRPDRAGQPQGGRRGTETTPNDGARPAPAGDTPVYRRPAESGRPGEQARPPRPDNTPVSRAAPIEVSKPPADRPETERRPAQDRPARPAPEPRAPDNRPAPESRPQPAPESRPQRAPENQPAARPERAPERQPERQPESRPQPQQRQPESRPAPQSQPQSSPPASSGGGRRRN